MPLSTLISRAWNLDTTTQLSGKADLDTARYDITAKVAPATSQAEFRLMIRHLLLEKLSLAVHIEPKETSVLELTVAKGGLRMKPAERAPSGDPPAFQGVSPDEHGDLQLPAGYPAAVTVPTPSGGLALLGRVQTIDGLIKQLRWPIGQIIIDKTGLTGTYDFAVRCSKEDLAPAANPDGIGRLPDPKCPRKLR